MVNILTEVQQARKSSKLLDSLKVRFWSGTWGPGGGGGLVGLRVRYF